MDQAPELIRHSQIGEDGVFKTPSIDVMIPSDKETINLNQGDAVVMVSRWQALELAKELLCYRDWLKVNKVVINEPSLYPISDDE